MQQWFNGLTRQEQIMISLGGTAVLAYLVFVIFLRPMANSADVLEQQNNVAMESLSQVKNLAAEFNSLRAAGASNTKTGKQNLARLVDTSVKRNQLTMLRFQPSASGDVQVRFENAVFNHVIAWLAELEIDNGVLIKDLSISPGNAGGIVNVSVRLREGI